MDLRCPDCRGEIARNDGSLGCSSCGRSYDLAEGFLPVLVAQELSDQHRHQRAYFDAEFSAYEDYSIDDWRQSFNDRIFRALDLQAHRPYLDVGVGGSGATVIEAARMGVEAVGCDLSVEGVMRAARFAAGQSLEADASFVVCAAESLPFPDASVGSASAVALLEHLDDDSEAVAELARVVRAGGRVWVTVPHTYRHIPLPVWPLYWIHDRRIGHKRHYGAERLTQLFVAHGFRHVQTLYTGHPVKLVQYAATLACRLLRRDMTKLWWRLERRDLARIASPRGALQISAVFERLDGEPRT